MAANFEDLMQAAYRYWKQSRLESYGPHPDEEDWADFLEGRLSVSRSEKIKEHILHCDSCLEIVSIVVNFNDNEELDVPLELILKGKDLVTRRESPPSLEIWLKLKADVLEVINTNGDILVGQELLPAPVLRTRNIKHFKDGLTILKDFKDIRLEARVNSKQDKLFNIAITLKDKRTQKEAKDLRVTLLKGDVELESYVAKDGKVIFEHIHAGIYSILVLSPTEKLAAVILDIKI